MTTSSNELPVLSAGELSKLRFAARAWLWGGSRYQRIRNCGRATTGQATVLLRYPDGTIAGDGLQHCKSVWACPVCSARILSQRADKLTRVLDAWRGMGHSVAMVTLTMSHDRWERDEDGNIRRDETGEGIFSKLSELWADVQGAFTAVLASPAWKRAQEEYGVVLKPREREPLTPALLDRAVAESDSPMQIVRLEEGRAILSDLSVQRAKGRRIPVIRAVEVTWGPVYGWHVHVHALLLYRGDVDAETALSEMWIGDETRGTRGLLGRWEYQANKRGRVADHRAQEAHVVRGTSADEVAGYLAKAVLDGDVSKELTRGDVKIAHGQHFTPFQMLAVLASGGHPEKEAVFAALWREWEQVSKGKRQMVISRDLLEFLDVDGVGLDDDDAAFDSSDLREAGRPLVKAGLSDKQQSDNAARDQYWTPAGPPEVVGVVGSRAWHSTVSLRYADLGGAADVGRLGAYIEALGVEVEQIDGRSLELVNWCGPEKAVISARQW